MNVSTAEPTRTAAGDQLVELWRSEQPLRVAAFRNAIVQRNRLLIGRQEEPGNRGLSKQDLIPPGADGAAWCGYFAQHSWARAAEALGYATFEEGQPAEGRPRLNIHHLGLGADRSHRDSASVHKWQNHARAADAYTHFPDRLLTPSEELQAQPGDVILIERAPHGRNSGFGHIMTVDHEAVVGDVRGYVCVGANVNGGVQEQFVPADNRDGLLIGKADAEKMLVAAENRWVARSPHEVARYAAQNCGPEARQRLAEAASARLDALERIDPTPGLLGRPVFRRNPASQPQADSAGTAAPAARLDDPVPELLGRPAFPVEAAGLQVTYHAGGNARAPMQNFRFSLPEIRIVDEGFAPPPAASSTTALVNSKPVPGASR